MWEVKKLREIVTQGITENEILLVLFKTAQFEYLIKTMLQHLLDTKDAKWEEYKASPPPLPPTPCFDLPPVCLQAKSVEHMTELSEYFSGEKPLARIAKDENLQVLWAPPSSPAPDLAPPR